MRAKIYKGLIIRQHSKLGRTSKYFAKARLGIERYGQLREGKATSLDFLPHPGEIFLKCLTSS